MTIVAKRIAMGLEASEVKRRIDIVFFIGQSVALKQQGNRWTGCCPFHDDTNPSFSVDQEKQNWRCYGCGKNGDVFSFVQERDGIDFRQAVTKLAELAGMHGRLPMLPPPSTKTAHALTPANGDTDAWRKQLEGIHPFEGSPAEAYLRGRGIGPLFPIICGVQYHPTWGGRPACVFFLRDEQEHIVAAEGRYIDNRDDPKVRTYGAKKDGAFWTPEAFEQSYVIIVESPINALSLAECGFPAVATCGTGNLVDWIPQACRGKTVYLCFDNDEGGNKAMERWKNDFFHSGAIPHRLIPRFDGLDINDFLQQYGRRNMQVALTRVISPECVISFEGYPTVIIGDQVRSSGHICTITKIHPPDEDFPCGWVDVVYADAIIGQADCRGLTTLDGERITPMTHTDAGRATMSEEPV